MVFVAVDGCRNSVKEETDPYEKINAYNKMSNISQN